jgi:hypothetical protein
MFLLQFLNFMSSYFYKYPSVKDGVAIYLEPPYIWAYVVTVPVKAA